MPCTGIRECLLFHNHYLLDTENFLIYAFREREVLVNNYQSVKQQNRIAARTYDFRYV